MGRHYNRSVDTLFGVLSQPIVGPPEMTSGSTKFGNLRKIITNIVVCANQKADPYDSGDESVGHL